MRTPFAQCTPYEKSQKMHPLQLHFEDEETRPDLQQFRVLMNHIQDKLNTNILEVDRQYKTPIAPVRRNTLIKEGRPRPDEEGKYPDYINVKFDPTSTPFITEDGEQVDLKSVDLRDYELTPTVWLRDVWKVQGTFYPRLVLKSCTLRRAPWGEQEEDDDDDMPSSVESDESEDMIEESQWR